MSTDNKFSENIIDVDTDLYKNATLRPCAVSELVGKSISNIAGCEIGSNIVTFYCDDNTSYIMYSEHIGDRPFIINQIYKYLPDIINTPICILNERIFPSNKQIEMENVMPMNIFPQDRSWVSVDFILRTYKGSLEIHWYGCPGLISNPKVKFAQVLSLN